MDVLDYSLAEYTYASVCVSVCVWMDPWENVSSGFNKFQIDQIIFIY